MVIRSRIVLKVNENIIWLDFIFNSRFVGWVLASPGLALSQSLEVDELLISRLHLYGWWHVGSVHSVQTLDPLYRLLQALKVVLIAKGVGCLFDKCSVLVVLQAEWVVGLVVLRAFCRVYVVVAELTLHRFYKLLGISLLVSSVLCQCYLSALVLSLGSHLLIDSKHAQYWLVFLLYLFFWRRWTGYYQLWRVLVVHLVLDT